MFMFSVACYDFCMYPLFNCSNSEMFIRVSAFILGVLFYQLWGSFFFALYNCMLFNLSSFTSMNGYKFSFLILFSLQ